MSELEEMSSDTCVEEEGMDGFKMWTSLLVVELYTEICLLPHLQARCNLEAFFLNHPPYGFLFIQISQLATKYNMHRGI